MKKKIETETHRFNISYNKRLEVLHVTRANLKCSLTFIIRTWLKMFHLGESWFDLLLCHCTKTADQSNTISPANTCVHSVKHRHQILLSKPETKSVCSVRDCDDNEIALKSEIGSCVISSGSFDVESGSE